MNTTENFSVRFLFGISLKRYPLIRKTYSRTFHDWISKCSEKDLSTKTVGKRTRSVLGEGERNTANRFRQCMQTPKPKHLQFSMLWKVITHDHYRFRQCREWIERIPHIQSTFLIWSFSQGSKPKQLPLAGTGKHIGTVQRDVAFDECKQECMAMWIIYFC